MDQKSPMIPSPIALLKTAMTDPMEKWKIYLHEWLDFYGFHVGKYTLSLEPLGKLGHLIEWVMSTSQPTPLRNKGFVKPLRETND